MSGEKKREDFIGLTGTRTLSLKIIDARIYPTTVAIRVQDNLGDEYWTELEDIDLDQ
jgi:hypothetical protein